MTERNLIVNADDLGASEGINRGICEAHARGIVTSTSLMVHEAAAREGVAVGRGHPTLSIGLHWDLDAHDTERVPLADGNAVRAELERQVEMFREMVGRDPSHLDSHHHVHRRPEVLPHARAVAAGLGLPLRGDGRAAYLGGFYGQWEYLLTDLQHVGVEFLLWLLQHEVGEGWTELACHPGWVTPGFESVYLHEREEEVRTLTNPAVRRKVDELGIRLRSFADLPPRPSGVA